MTIYFLIVFGFYFAFLLFLLRGWKKATQQTAQTAADTKFISVVVAMRNERVNIGNLLRSLSLQDYPNGHFEIILADDHSEDGSETEARKWSDRIPSLKLISLGAHEKGKKAALTAAIGIANGELIATTDADCTIPPHWLTRINETFQSKTASMCIGAVALQNENTFFSQLQSIEFASVMGTGLSFAAMDKPIMCNGANLSFPKKIFDDVSGYKGNENVASGDDEFLMRKITEKKNNSIAVLADCVVVTRPQANVKQFIHQRLRWANKWKHNSSILARLLAVFIFTVQFSWFALLVLPIFYPSPIFAAVFVVKILLDLILLSITSRALGMKFNLLAFTALQFLYPFYVLYVGLFSQAKNHQWKGRRI